MSAQETCSILCNERTGACAEHGDLLLDLLDIIFAGFEVDLQTSLVRANHMEQDQQTSLIATMSPVVRQMPLNTVPKEPLPNSGLPLASVPMTPDGRAAYLPTPDTHSLLPQLTL